VWRRSSFSASCPLLRLFFVTDGEFQDVPKLDLDCLESAWQEAEFELYLAEGNMGHCNPLCLRVLFVCSRGLPMAKKKTTELRFDAGCARVLPHCRV